MAAAAGQVGTPLARPIEELGARYDVVVVGSGYGGAVAACRLARTGAAVCVLERGRERRPGQYPDSWLKARREVQLNHRFRLPRDPRRLFEFHANKEVNALVGSGLGGTSLINANVVEPAVDGVFRDPVWPAALRMENGRRPLAPYEQRARDMLRPAAYPVESPPLAKLDALEFVAAATGPPTTFRRPELAVSFEKHVGPGGVRQRACTGCGDCVTGCNEGAKNTTLMNYLPDAVVHGAEVFCEIEVDRVERAADDTWLVHVRLLGDGRRRFGRRTMFIRADVVVLGAGSLGSTAIMLRSRDRGLAVGSALGSRFSGNADVLAFGYDADREIAAFAGPSRPPPLVGPCITGIIDTRTDVDVDQGYVIEEGSVPTAIGWATTGLLGLTAWGRAGSRTAPGRLGRRLESLIHGPTTGAADRSQVYLAMGHDDSDGRLRLDRRRNVRIEWPGAGGKQVFDRIDRHIAAGNDALGALHRTNPLWNKYFGKDLITVHPLGGCPMGDDPAAAVVDDAGRVYSARPGERHHPGLYVVDGAIMPRSVGINPLLTISAVAERAVEQLAADRGWAIGVAPAPTGPASQERGDAGVRFTERMRGSHVPEGGPRSDMQFVLTIVTPPIEQFLADPAHVAHLVGSCTCAALSSEPMTVRDGRFELFRADPGRPDTRLMRYRFDLDTVEGRHHRFEGTKVVGVRSGRHALRDTTTLAVTVHTDGERAGTAVLRIGALDFVRQLLSMSATGTDGSAGRASVRRFQHFFASVLQDQYGGLLSRPAYPAAGPQRIERPLRCGPPTEIVDVPTGDGVPVRLTRFGSGTKGPVLLVHGAGVSSGIFSTDLVDTNLVESLTAADFDVWLLDARFSTALPSSSVASDGDAVAEHDIPAAVRTVLDRTGTPSLQAVVHCYGANTFFMAMLRGMPGVRSIVASQVAAHLDTGPLTDLKTHGRVPSAVRLLRIRHLDASARRRPRQRMVRIADRALRVFPPAPDGEGCRNASCRRATGLYGPLWAHENLDAHLHDHLHELLGPASLGVFCHLAAMVRAGHLVDAAGRDTYLPGVHHLLDVPIRLLHGERNGCYDPSSTERTERWLHAAGHTAVDRRVVPGHGHLDCIFGTRAADAVHPLIVEHLEVTS